MNYNFLLHPRQRILVWPLLKASIYKTNFHISTSPGEVQKDGILSRLYDVEFLSALTAEDLQAHCLTKIGSRGSASKITLNLFVHWAKMTGGNTLNRPKTVSVHLETVLVWYDALI